MSPSSSFSEKGDSEKEFKVMRGALDTESKYKQVIELINSKQKTERTLEEFVDYVLTKFSS